MRPRNGWRRRGGRLNTIKRDLALNYQILNKAEIDHLNKLTKQAVNADYSEPDFELRLIKGQERDKREAIQMGEAKQIVQGKTKKKIREIGSVLDRLEDMIEDLDKALDIKERDLDGEGRDSAAENHFKLGILRASDSLLRRAKALLEDYGTDLDFDTDPTYDEQAAKGGDLENRVIDLRKDKSDDEYESFDYEDDEEDE